MAVTLWLTDRSRYERGLGHCARARYHNYHAGPHGYGWDRKAQSIPQVTGTLVHDPITKTLQELATTGEVPDDGWIYDQAILPAIMRYHDLVEKRGLTTITDEADLANATAEQVTLLEGLVWCWVRVALPAYADEWVPVLIEAEEAVVLGCTCGLGERIGELEDHDGRNCQGIGWMTRGDCIARRKSGADAYRYDEFKTTSTATMNWEAAWPYKAQLKAGVLGAERRLEKTVDEVYIHALIKGQRRSEWNPAEGKASGPKFQNSPLAYGWRRPANPPLNEEDWAPSQYYEDVDGKRRKNTQHKRTGLWHLPESLWGQCLSPVHFWTRWIGPTLGQSYKLLGPIYRNEADLRSFLTQLVGEERRWQATLWQLHDAITGAGSWASPEVQEVLDLEVPQIRGDACHGYFGEECNYVPLCDHHPGWEDPALMGYIPRRPHHTPELEQAIERGLLPPDEGVAWEPEE